MFALSFLHFFVIYFCSEEIEELMAGATRDFRAIFDNLIQMGAVSHGFKAGKER